MDGRVTAGTGQIRIHLYRHTLGCIEKGALMGQTERNGKISMLIHGRNGAEEQIRRSVCIHPALGAVVHMAGEIADGIAGKALAGIPHQECHINVKGVPILGIHHKRVLKTAHGAVHLYVVHPAIELVQPVKNSGRFVGRLGSRQYTAALDGIQHGVDGGQFLLVFSAVVQNVAPFFRLGSI